MAKRNAVVVTHTRLRQTGTVVAEAVMLVFENGKAARIPMAAYETKTNRRRLTGAY